MDVVAASATCSAIILQVTMNNEQKTVTRQILLQHAISRFAYRFNKKKKNKEKKNIYVYSSFMGRAQTVMSE